MLGSAILVCLAGLMFSSDRFAGAKLAYYANEYNGLVSTRMRERGGRVKVRLE